MERTVNISIDLVQDLKIRQRRDNEILGVCPVCGCRDANFNVGKLMWRCWHCPAKGKIMTKEGYEVKEVELPTLDIPEIRKLYTSLTDKYHKGLTKAASEYLKARGLTEDTIEKFQLGFCSTNFYDEYTNKLAEDAGILYQNYPVLSNRITIPYLAGGEATDLRGRILNNVFTYKENTPTYTSLAGNHSARGAIFLFNHDIIDKNNELILTEGEFKSIVGDQYGFPVIATPGIFGWQKEWSELLKSKQIILAADFDKISGLRSPAYLMTKMLVKELPNLRVALLQWVSNKEKVDIDSLLVSGNIKAFEKAIKGALDARLWLQLEERKGYARKQ